MPGFGFAKADRLRKRAEFLRLSHSGQKVANQEFLLIAAPASGDRSRLGITVTKKIGKAVLRNRIKRVCREFFRLNRHQLRGHWDINLIARKSASACSSEALYSSLRHVFNRFSRQFDR